MVPGPSGPRRCRISRRGERCNRALLRPHTDGDNSRRCRVVRRVVVDYRWGGGGRALSFSLEGGLLMDRHLLFVLGRLITLFCGHSSTSRGRALGLLNRRHLEQSLHLVSNAPRLGV